MGEAYVDFLIIVVISLLFLGLLKVLLSMSQKWQDSMDERVKDAIAYREKRKKISPDPFREENGYSWDYVMIFNVYDDDKPLTYDQIKYNLKHILSELAAGGLEMRLFYSVQADEVYCKLRCPLDRLMKEADRIDYKLPLDAENLRALCFAGRPGEWDPLSIPVSHPDTSLDPYVHLYAKYEYDREDVADLYKKWPNGTVFRGCDRLKLIQSILTARKFEGGCHMDVYKLIKLNCMIGYFALHDYVELRALEAKWLHFFQWPWNQPVDDVKDYFGEKIGLYFLWLGHYTTWLIPASIVGFCAWINIAAEGNDPNNAVIAPYFAAFMALWSTLFLEFWKRKEKYYAMRWGTVGFEEEEVTRPQFIGEKQRNPVNGKEYLYFPARKKHIRLFKSSTIIGGFIVVVIGVVIGIFIMRLVLSHIKDLVVGGVQTAAIIASIANAIQIQIMNMIYGDMAIKLNDYENHRTDTAYEDNLIAKSFVFQFVNSYAALLYIAFVKPFLADLDPCVGSCMVELQTTLGTIFLTRLCVGNITEVGIPWFMQRQREKKETEGASKPLSEVEKNFIQEEYHVMMGTFNDYAEMSIQVRCNLFYFLFYQ